MDLSAISKKSKGVAMLLSFFLGIFGVDRFYLGYTLIGILKLLLYVIAIPIPIQYLGGVPAIKAIAAIGVFGWWIVDFIMIAIEKLKDKEGRYLRNGTAHKRQLKHEEEERKREQHEAALAMQKEEREKLVEQMFKRHFTGDIEETQALVIRIFKKEPAIGDSENVITDMFGEPDTVNKDISAKKTVETWKYGKQGNSYRMSVVLTNGIVSSFSDKR